MRPPCRRREHRWRVAAQAALPPEPLQKRQEMNPSDPLHFYEKVIKVKADVAAFRISFSESTMLRWVAWRAVKGAFWGVHLDP